MAIVTLHFTFCLVIPLGSLQYLSYLGIKCKLSTSPSLEGTHLVVVHLHCVVVLLSTRDHSHFCSKFTSLAAVHVHFRCIACTHLIVKDHALLCCRGAKQICWMDHIDPAQGLNLQSTFIAEVFPSFFVIVFIL